MKQERVESGWAKFRNLALWQKIILICGFLVSIGGIACLVYIPYFYKP